MKKRGVVLVCVTSQLECKKLILAGAALAKEENAVMRILSVFPKRQCYNPDLNALEVLNSAAAEAGAAMTVCFSDSPVEMTHQYAKDFNAVLIVTGFPKEKSTRFVTELHALMPEMPVNMIDDDGTAYGISRADAKKTSHEYTEFYAAENRDFRSLTYKAN